MDLRLTQSAVCVFVYLCVCVCFCQGFRLLVRLSGVRIITSASVKALDRSRSSIELSVDIGLQTPSAVDGKGRQTCVLVAKWINGAGWL